MQRHLRRISLCLMWGVMTSFLMAPLCDRTAYVRLAAARGYSMRTFHTGNFALHVLPVLLCWRELRRPSPRPALAHGVVAMGVHTAWALVTCGSLRLDRVYARMADRHWMLLWVAAWSAELGWVDWHRQRVTV